MAIVTVRETYSDHDMQCPSSWENGFKEGIVIRFGDGERAASNRWTGEWQGSTFDLEVSDHRRRFRQLLASATSRFWTEPQEIKMTTRANRAILGTPYTVFVGPIIGVQLTTLTCRFTLGDIVSQGLLADQHQIPWRKIGDAFLSELDEVSENLDPETPEPIIYGEHRRVPTQPGSPVVLDTPSAHGFQVVPTLLGVEGAYWLWMVAGHACAGIPDVLVWTPVEGQPGLGTSASMIGDPGWRIPHDGEPAYEDRRSDTYGNDRRYTLIRGLVGNADADACANGEKTLTVFVDGVEPVGDGTGAVIRDRIQQEKHFLINFVAHRGIDSYQSGDWLSNPTWDLFDGPVLIIDEDSFDRCSAIAAERLPAAAGSPADDAGYIGAALIGAKAGDRSSVRRWLADWNRSCGLQFGVTHLGQLRVFMLHPTEEIKAAAPLYTDAYEILKDSFGTDVRWADMANRIPFRTDYEHTSGIWKTTDVAVAGDAIANYGREITGELRDYPFAPGITASYHLARLEALTRKHPERMITLEATIGPDYTNASLGYLDLGDYIRYQHFAAVGSAAEIRLAQIVRHQVQAGKRRVLVEAYDCEDLIGYDEAPVFEDILNDTCQTAIEVEQEPFTPLSWHLNTTAHQTDETVSTLGSPALLPLPGIAYHAAWWKWTAPANGTLLLTTVHSLYDTQMAVLTGGTCGASPPDWTLEQYNNDDTVYGGTTSILEFPVVMGTEYYILVYGYGPDDGGDLTFGFYFTEPE